MGGRRVGDILEEAAQFEGGVPLSRMIDLRHELTFLIKSELYGGGDKIEGRAALTARQRLDGFFFHTNPLGATAAELDGLKSAIILTTLAEQADLLAQARDAGGGIKAEMLKLMNDPDRFDRFNDQDKAAIREIARGWSFFAKIRFKALHETIRRRGIPYMHTHTRARTPASSTPAGQ
ncbi:MAG TPA: hypothetical protein VGG86_02085 [Roseiarcus sp.]